MSRIGKQPVSLPAGVEAGFENGVLTVKGPKGSLQQEVNPAIQVSVEGAEVKFERSSDQAEHRALHGLYRALCNNMVEGVSKGYARRLEVHGVGYNCVVEGKKVSMNVGFSHPVVFEIPAGVTAVCPNNTTLDISGIDKQVVGDFAARIRLSRPSEPYKGKGIRYAGEQIKRKAGKAAAGGK